MSVQNNQNTIAPPSPRLSDSAVPAAGRVTSGLKSNK